MDADNPNLRELVTFRLGEERYAIDIQSVREIRGWSPATPLPNAQPFMQGVVNLRGLVLPVMDLARRLGGPASAPSARHAVIVIEYEGRLMGLLVDAVSGILGIEPGSLQPAPDLSGGGSESLLEGIITGADGMTSLLDLAWLVPEAVAEAA
ncbi:MAG: chemotaxis protein CheW [Alphaproteobacteria bacterium]|nr:chemotaxis protein CheW [Alphaproteobacteria bacterium]MBU2271981.1 chemotaxis protein CheW [Alphaproteobacteria bacterium]MBU2417310.1 chemotaxis protein CheW [Alphaproteobacteria bacterium]